MIWYSPITGEKFPVGRHGGEGVPIGILRNIKKRHGLNNPHFSYIPRSFLLWQNISIRHSNQISEPHFAQLALFHAALDLYAKHVYNEDVKQERRKAMNAVFYPAIFHPEELGYSVTISAPGTANFFIRSRYCSKAV